MRTAPILLIDKQAQQARYEDASTENKESSSTVKVSDCMKDTIGSVSCSILGICSERSLVFRSQRAPSKKRP